MPIRGCAGQSGKAGADRCGPIDRFAQATPHTPAGSGPGRPDKYPRRRSASFADTAGACAPLCGAFPRRILGGKLPKNWRVTPFGDTSPKEFLSQHDFFVYFTHPDWIESFGRTIIEAMAVGVPVILNDVYRPLFGDAALYATPQTAVEIARKLHADPVAYAEQVEKAQRLVVERFSYETHLRRIGAAR